MGRGEDYGGWAPYVPVAQRRRQAERKASALKKKGQDCQPVVIADRAIASSVWGKAWCNNLEAYSDFANRLPRGRTYVRNGCVIDLCIATGQVNALVSGSEIYRVEVGVQALEPALWKEIITACSGKVASLIELLQGRLSKAVMDVVTRPGQGLFPQPQQLRFSCSCPDGASMCKHVAATLYGVGARLDAEPALLFRLRHVDPQALIQQMGKLSPVGTPDAQGSLDSADLSALFDIELGEPAHRAAAPVVPPQMPQMPQMPARPLVPLVPLVPASQATAKTKPAAKTTPAAKKVSKAKTLSASELIARGIPRHMIYAWLGTSVLALTSQRGVYRTTAQTESRIKAYLARGETR